MGYRSGPNPVDNGQGNQFVSGATVGDAVAGQLTSLRTAFEEIADALR